MWEADRILKSYEASGILIGGLAKAILRGVTDREKLAEHKDVDVLLSDGLSCDKHPRQWEGGIDWWVSHSDSDSENQTNGESPTNGATNLLRGILFCTLRTGLYICEAGPLRELADIEAATFGDSFIVSRPGRKNPDIGFPYAAGLLKWEPKRMAVHCKPL